MSKPTVELHLGDCVEVMRGMADASVDLVLTSPPYDGIRKYTDGAAFDFPATAAEIKRLLRPGGVCVWVVGDQTINGSESGSSFRQALHFKEIGLRQHDTMIYAKRNPLPGDERTPRYVSAFEFMFVFSNGKPRVWSPLRAPCKHAGRFSGGKFYEPDGSLSPKHGANRAVKSTKVRSNIWSYPVGFVKNGHPAVFPLQLAIDHILSWTSPAGTVLDPFVGSGTTLEACLKTGRNGIGIDKSAEYLAIARQRLARTQEEAA